MIEFHWSGITFLLADCGGGRLLKNIPMHYHSKNSYELHFITDGKGRLQTEADEYNLNKGDFFITGPLVKHSQLSDKDNPLQDVFIYLQVKNTDNTGKTAALFLNADFCFYNQFDTKIPEQILFEYKNSFPAREDMLSGLLKQLLTGIIRRYGEDSPDLSVSYDSLDEQRFLIIENMFLYEKNLTLSALASRLGLSERQTQRILKTHYDKSFRDILKDSDFKNN